MIRTTSVDGSAFLAAILVTAGALQLTGCASSLPEAENERLDTNTGTTLTVMPKPIELVVERVRGERNDPFAYLAPFETNRMGSHELYLWVSAPQVEGALATPQVFCGESEVALEKFDGTPREMGLSGPPYKMPAPWSVQWYFRLSGEVLDCFSGAPRIRVTTQAAEGQRDSYVAEGPALSGLGAFTAKVRT